MSLHPRLSCSLLAASLLLAGCSSGPHRQPHRQTDDGRPLGEPRPQPGILSAGFLGQYTVKHAFINGINIDRCYPGVPPDHVQVVMMTTPSGFTTPGIVVTGGGRPPRPASEAAAFIGSQYSNTSNKYQPDGTVLRNPDGTPQEQVDKWWKFNPLCKAEFAGGNGIYFGIRSAASESIETYLQKLLSWLVRLIAITSLTVL